MPGLFLLSLLPCISKPSCRQNTKQLYSDQLHLSTLAQKDLSMCWQAGGQAISEAISVSPVRKHFNFNLKPGFLKGGWFVHSLIILSHWGSTEDQLTHGIRGRTCDSWFPSSELFCGEQTCPLVISKDLGHSTWVIFSSARFLHLGYPPRSLPKVCEHKQVITLLIRIFLHLPLKSPRKKEDIVDIFSQWEGKTLLAYQDRI